jgi:flagellar biosynthetic protein FlhB
MRPEQSADNRTEAPTPRRIREARSKGQVAHSRDLAAAIALLGAIGALALAGPSFVEGLTSALRGSLENLHRMPEDADAVRAAIVAAGAASLRGAALLLLAIVAAAAASHLVQVGFLFTVDPILPQSSRLDPSEGMRRAFSWRTGVRLLGGLVRGAVVAAVLAATLWKEWPVLLSLSQRELPEAIQVASSTAFALALRAALALLALGLLDWAYQRWQHRRDLSMSRQEVRDELRRFEGDPAIRDRRRALRRRLAAQRMIPLAARATVMVTDAADLCAALRYDPESGGPPELLARGRGALADRLREVAMERGIPVIERPDLARPLHRRGELGEEIPADLHGPAAEVLALALRMRPQLTPA